MRWVLDGYNVIRRDPDLRARESDSLEAGRAALLALTARLARNTSDSFTIVFDGARRAPANAAGGGRVQIVFSQPPETADDVLRRLAAGLREGAVVVTSDRAVQTAARRVRAVAVSAEAFLAAATSPGAADVREDEIHDDDVVPSRGPRRRPSREARAAERALLRLRPR